MAYDVTFNQAVSGVDSADFTVTNVSGAAGGSIATNDVVDSGDHIHYTVTVRGIAGDGTERLDLNSSATGITAVSDGSAITGGFTTGIQVTFDHTAPSITGITLNAGTYRLGDTVTATITTNAYDGNGAYTLATGSTVDGMTLTGWTYSTSAHSGTATFLVTSSTSEVIRGSIADSVIVTDAAGNSSATYTTAITGPITIDRQAPTAIGIAGFSGTTTLTGTTLSAGGSVVGALTATDGTPNDTFTYSILGADAGMFEVLNGALTVASDATLTNGQTYTIQLQCQDAGGNALSSPQAISITAATPPVVQLNLAQVWLTRSRQRTLGDQRHNGWNLSGQGYQQRRKFQPVELHCAGQRKISLQRQ